MTAITNWQVDIKPYSSSLLSMHFQWDGALLQGSVQLAIYIRFVYSTWYTMHTNRDSWVIDTLNTIATTLCIRCTDHRNYLLEMTYFTRVWKFFTLVVRFCVTPACNVTSSALTNITGALHWIDKIELHLKFATLLCTLKNKLNNVALLSGRQRQHRACTHRGHLKPRMCSYSK